MALFEVVKYNGGSDVFAWKYPNESLGNLTQVIVHETQEAVVFKSGKALEVLGSGRHTLDTANVPILKQFVNLPFGGKSPYSAEIWYVNKAYNLDVKWGTATPIQIQDTKYNIFVPIRANGIFGMKIGDSKKFLCKLVGTLPIFDKENVSKFFRGLIITKAKDTVSTYVVKKGISVVEINAFIDELSECIKAQCKAVLEEYGITLVNFYVNNISVPEDDIAVKKVKAALAKKAEMDIIGFNYQQERSFDALQGIAENDGTGAAEFIGASMGLGAGMGMANNMNQAVQQMTQGMQFSNAPQNENGCKCVKCGGLIQKNTKFCSNCGKKYEPCPKCSADLEEGAKKCNACGYELPGKCDKCGNMVEKGIKFCPECGNSLVRKCPKCNTVIEGSTKFCTECGEKLEGDK